MAVQCFLGGPDDAFYRPRSSWGYLVVYVSGIRTPYREASMRLRKGMYSARELTRGRITLRRPPSRLSQQRLGP